MSKGSKAAKSGSEADEAEDEEGAVWYDDWVGEVGGDPETEDAPDEGVADPPTAGWMTKCRTSFKVWSKGKILLLVSNTMACQHVAIGATEGLNMALAAAVDVELVGTFPQTQAYTLLSLSKHVQVHPYCISRAMASQYRSVCSRFRRPDVGRN